MLVLEDGSVFHGHSMGADGEWVGEVVFNTSMTGYQEIITDPSYWGQMVVFTCPHIGNVGINLDDAESKEPFVRAVLARRICEVPSNWRSQQPLPDYLKSRGVPALAGLDTRRLTLTLREKGVMRAALSTLSDDMARLLEMARTAPDMSLLSPVQEISPTTGPVWTARVAERWIANLDHRMEPNGDAPHVVVIDCGIKHNILRHLAGLGANVTVVPADATPQEIMAHAPDGMLISNGPGDPDQAVATVQTVRQLMGRMPMFGICLGHQIIALAAGARIYKLPFGHHGGNHPVQDLVTGRIEITAQNHNYAVVAHSLEGLPFEVTHVNLYDGTIEGIAHRNLPVSGIQYHPEASPGPHDSLYLLSRFVHALTGARA
jgi:carbamoyl-phosphate synthase small subunit